MPTGAIDAELPNVNYDVSIVGFISPAVLLYYDFILTFHTEVARFWSPLQCNWGTVVFLLNRYVVIFGHIPIIAEVFLPNPTGKNCHVLQSYHQYMAVIIQVIVGAVMIIRIYALWERSRVILTILVVTGLAVLAFGAWSLVSGKRSSPPILSPGTMGCTAGLSPNQAWHLGAAWGGVLLFDTMIFGLTVFKTLKIGRTSRRTMVDVLLRDGSMYFAVMGTATLCNVLTFLFGGTFTRGITTTYTNVLASTCAARLMLNVRDPAIQWTTPRTTHNTSRSSGPFVSTFVDVGPTQIDPTPPQNEIELVPRTESEQGARSAV